MQRVGPYSIVGERRRVPGASFAPATGPGGERVLLQLATLRADMFEPERHRLERALALATRQLLDEPDLGVQAHGGAEEPDGARTLYWALPVPTEPFLVDRGARLTAPELLAVAGALLRRLAIRHALRRAEPLLSEHALVLSALGVRLIGVPAFIPASALAADILPVRLAPEETLTQSVQPRGDLYRLGLALRELARRAGIEAPGVHGLIEALAEPDPSQRIGGVHEALSELESVSAGLGPDPGAPAPFSALLSAIASPPEDSSTGDAEHPAPKRASVLAAQTAATPAEETQTGPVALDPELSEARTSVDHFRGVAPRTPVSPVDIASRMPTLIVTRPLAHGFGAPVALEAVAAAWQAPVLPAGQSPWSEVLSAANAARPAVSAFTGFREELPGPSVRTTQARRPAPDEDLDGAGARLAERHRTSKRRALAVALIAGAAFSAAVVVLARSPRESGRSRAAVASVGNEVWLEAEPVGATIVSERDGVVLGRAPLKFLVPQGTSAAVLVSAPGFDPQRVVLPERGRLIATLSPISPGLRCRVRLSASEGAELEGIDAELGPGLDRAIDGALVVRAREGQGVRGAEIVRCPALGGASERRLRLHAPPAASELTITQPAGFAIVADGRALGRAPARVESSSAFTRLRVEGTDGSSEERWVPVVHALEVQLPSPRRSKGPVVISGDDTAERITVATRGPAGGGRAPTLSAEQNLRVGARLIGEGRSEQALAPLNACIDLDPAQAECHRLLGGLLESRAPEKAKGHLRRYLELRPNASDRDGVRKRLLALE